MSSDRVPPRSGLSRRRLLIGGAAAGVGAAAVAAGSDLVFAARADAAAAAADAAHANGPQSIPFHGEHQAGVEMVPQTHQSLLSLNLRPDVGRDNVRRLLRILTDDARRLSTGDHALADSEPELALLPAKLTVTFGFGRRLVDIVNPSGGAPAWLTDLPPFEVDRLDENWNSGDLLLQVAADDPLTLAHANRMLLKDARTFAVVKWTQSGFRRAYGTERPGRTQRNLFGQLDGTVNPKPGTEDFADVVWRGGDNPEWLSGGTGMVIRRIGMLLDKWDRLDRVGREEAVGRTLASGAPLTGSQEHDEPDFSATNALGFPVIAEFAHIRRARSDDPRQRIYRRAYNYDELTPGDQLSRSGLIFTSFQNDVTAQFVPIQRRLDELDLLNEWIVPIGSAVFAIPPGCGPDGFVGETMFQ